MHVLIFCCIQPFARPFGLFTLSLAPGATAQGMNRFCPNQLDIQEKENTMVKGRATLAPMIAINIGNWNQVKDRSNDGLLFQTHGAFWMS